MQTVEHSQAPPLGIPGISDDVIEVLRSSSRPVQQHSLPWHDGEIVLYRAGIDETYVLTTARLVASDQQVAEVIADADAEAVVIPRTAFNICMSLSGAFRGFVFEAYSKRIADLSLEIRRMASQRLDVRGTSEEEET